MDSTTIEYGLKTLEDENCLAEALIHPCHYSTKNNNQHFEEYLITQNKELENKILGMGFEITSYKKEQAVV